MTPVFSSPPRKNAIVCIVGALILSWAPPSGACGYHDDVSIARGALNWVYPDSLHVIGAISAAIAAKRLAYRDEGPVTADLFGSRYNATVRTLQRFGDSLASARDAAPPSLSVVLVELMLWTRFENAGGELRAEFHASGPRPGDLVLVTGRDVVREIAAGALTVGEAHGLGLIRLYGSDSQAAAFIEAFRAVGKADRSLSNQSYTPGDRLPAATP